MTTHRTGSLCAGLLFGTLMFGLFLGTLLLAGDLSASKFIYVDF